MADRPLRFFVAGALGRLFQTTRCRTRHGFDLRGNSRDMVARYIYTFGIWEPQLTAFVKDRVGPGTHFYDLGTHVGYFSLLAASLGARVTGIDAAPEMAAQCRANLAAAGFEGVVHNKAIAPEEGTLVLYNRAGLAKVHKGARTIVPLPGATPYAEVPAAPLPALVEIDPSVPNFFKIDIEGAETTVLDHLVELLGRHDEMEVTIVVELEQMLDHYIAQFRKVGCDVFFLRNDYSLDYYKTAREEYRLVGLDEPRPPLPFETVFVRGRRGGG